MRIKYDKQTDTLYVTFVEKEIKESEYLEREGIIADFDEMGNLIGIEILSVSKKWPLEEVTKLYYEPAGI